MAGALEPGWAERDELDVYVRVANDDPDAPPTTHAAEDWLPAWSPDGEQIAFWSTRSGEWELYLMRPDGAGVRRVSDEHGRGGRGVSRAAWSPDSQRMMIVTTRDPSRDMQLVELDLRTGETTPITTGRDSKIDPQWTSR